MTTINVSTKENPGVPMDVDGSVSVVVVEVEVVVGTVVVVGASNDTSASPYGTQRSLAFPSGDQFTMSAKSQLTVS